MEKEASGEVKLIAGLLYADESRVSLSTSELERAFGPLDFVSPALAFDETDYYSAEMGAPLFRRFVSFERLVAPEKLPEIKRTTREMEEGLAAGPGRRTVNIDPGYLDFDKVVLASFKRGPYKIVLAPGIYADMTLHYEKGRFLPFPWTFADFRDGRYNDFLLKIRERFKARRSG